MGVGWGAWAMTHPGYLAEQWEELEPLLASGAIFTVAGLVLAAGVLGAAVQSLGQVSEALFLLVMPIVIYNVRQMRKLEAR